MISPTTLGNFTLNLAFVLYLIVYLPQIRHNTHKHHLAELSVSLHMIIMTSFALDLLYALFKPLPWQYRAVSIAALCTLSIQQFQLMRFAQERGQVKLLAVLCLFSLSLIGILMLLGVFYFEAMAHSRDTVLFVGWISRLGFLSYVAPQIIKNYRLHSAKALSTTFLTISLFLSLLDLTSAWCLNWGWPNQLGTPLTISLTLTLLWQKKRYA
ncbi:MAG: PQ-loop repeat-containing protein [Legionella sp.]|nr:PQ-loop repeat-containing protein [Legionella sp.]